MSKFCTAAVAALVLGGAIAYHVSAADDHASAPKPVLPPGASDAPAPTAFDHLETALDQVIKVQLVDAYIGDAAAFLHTAGGVPAAYDGDGKTLPVTITASHLPLRCLAELIAALSGTTLTYESGGLVFRPANDERLKTDLDRVVALPAGGSLPWGRAMDVLRSEGAPIVDSVPAETAALEVSFRQQDPQSGTEAASRPLRGWIDLIVSQRHQRWTVVHGWVAIGADALSRPSPAVAQALAKALDKNISVDFSESSFHDVVTFLTQIGGVDIIIGPGITDLPPITFKCKSMPLRTAMQWIANLTGTHCWTRAGAIIFDAGTDVSPLHPVEAHDEIKLQQQAATATAP